MKNQINRGFTLVELSIVLVIIGLIVGGVVGGRALVDSSKINNAVTDYSKYLAAYNGFELQYGNKPGDIPDAKSYWPNDSLYSGFATTNGDGNGLIVHGAEGPSAMQHLYAADLLGVAVKGAGECGYSGVGYVIDCNIPSSAFAKTGFAILWGGTSAGMRGRFNQIRLASDTNRSGAYDSYLDSGGLTPREAKQIDKKIDDGQPTSGKLKGYSGSGYNKYSEPETACEVGGKYVLSHNETPCMLFYKIE